MSNLSAKIEDTISVCPHPLRAERFDMAMPMGLTIEHMIRYVQPDARLRQHAHVHINGRYINSSQWSYVRPFAGDAVEIRMIPRGGSGDKSPLRTILTIVVMAAATYVSGGIAAMGTSVWYNVAGAAAGAAISMVGMMVVNAIAPPPTQDMPEPSEGITDKPAYIIEAARNRARRYEPIRKIIGRHRVVPDLAAQPYTEIVGDDQYFRMVFCWGYEPLQIEDLKIGETPITNFDDIDIEHRQGDGSLSLYPDIVNEEALQIELTGSSGWSTRTTETKTDEISIDITFPGGLVEFDDRGNRSSRAVEFEIQYAPAGTDDWSIAGDTTESISSQDVNLRFEKAYESVTIQIDRFTGRIFTKIGAYTNEILVKDMAYGLAHCYYECTNWESGNYRYCIAWNLVVDDIRNSDNITGLAPSKNDETTVNIDSGSVYVPYMYFRQATTSRISRSVRFNPDSRGQYDVRLRRVTSNSDSNQVRDTSFWTRLRSFQNDDPVKRNDVALTAIKIKATGQLNGIIDQFNGICTSVLPFWNSTDEIWEEQPTRRVEAGYRTLLQGNGMSDPLPDSRINLTDIQSWAEWCASEGFICDLVIERRESVRKHLQNICSTGRATSSLVDGNWGVVVDKPRSTIAQHVTPRNSWGYQGSKEFNEVPHAFKVRFTNQEKGYRQDTRIVYRDGYDESNATDFEEIQLSGVTDPDLAWRHGRYHLAVALLRPEQHTFKIDPEHLVANRGDLIKFAHTVPLFGIKSARVKSITDTDDDGDIEQVTVDDIFPMESGKTYFVRFRLADGTSLLKEIETDPGEQYTVTFSTPEPEADAPESGDLAMFGESDLESVDMVIKSIEPTNDLNAKITCVDASPAIHDVDTGTIPAFDSQITESPFIEPPKPNIENVRSNEEVLYRDTDGSLSSRIVVDFSILSGLENILVGTEVQFKEVSEASWTKLSRLDSTARSVSFKDVEQGVEYDLRLRTIHREGAASSWTTISGHTVVGKSTPPPDVTAVFVENGHLHWKYPIKPKDFRGFRIKHASGNVRNWGKGSDVGPEIHDSSPADISRFGSGIRTFMIRGEDTAGNQSKSIAFIVTNLGDPPIENVTKESSYEPGWDGVLTGGFINVNDNLEAEQNTYLWDAKDGKLFWTGNDGELFYTSQYSKMQFQTEYSPAQSAYLTLPVVLDADNGWSLEIREALADIIWQAKDSRKFWSGVDSSDFWQAQSGDWFAFPGRMKVLEQPYDLLLTTFEGGEKSIVDSFIPTLDVPDVVEELQDISIDSGGSRLPIEKEFDKIKSVNMVLQYTDAENAYTLKIQDKETIGPMIEAFDNQGDSTSALIDAEVYGYELNI